MIKQWLNKRKQKKIHERRMEQMKKNPYKRVDSENMNEIEKMDKGFNGKTYTMNGMDIDF